jgi:hypothetical protein
LLINVKIKLLFTVILAIHAAIICTTAFLLPGCVVNFKYTHVNGSPAVLNIALYPTAIAVLKVQY